MSPIFRRYGSCDRSRDYGSGRIDNMVILPSMTPCRVMLVQRQHTQPYQDQSLTTLRWDLTIQVMSGEVVVRIAGPIDTEMTMNAGGTCYIPAGTAYLLRVTSACLISMLHSPVDDIAPGAE